MNKNETHINSDNSNQSIKKNPIDISYIENNDNTQSKATQEIQILQDSKSEPSNQEMYKINNTVKDQSSKYSITKKNNLTPVYKNNTPSSYNSSSQENRNNDFGNSNRFLIVPEEKKNPKIMK